VEDIFITTPVLENTICEYQSRLTALVIMKDLTFYLEFHLSEDGGADAIRTRNPHNAIV
jgi:hypothetical protein